MSDMPTLITGAAVTSTAEAAPGSPAAAAPAAAAPAASTSATPAAPAAAAAAPAAAAAAVEGAPAGVGGESAEAPKVEGAAEGEAQAAPQGAPESYADFIIPEGVSIDAELGGSLKDLAKELNLTQEQAQRVMDLGVKQAQGLSTSLADTVATAKATWAQETMADADIGGEKLQASVTSAQRALNTFGTPALKQLLDQTGLGNHPEVIRAFAKAGAAISEDTLLPPNPGDGGAGKADTTTFAGKAQKLYGNHP